MAENIYSGYAYEMYYPPAGFEKANFTVKTFFIHLVSPLIKEFLSFPDPRSQSRAGKCGMTFVYIWYLIPRSPAARIFILFCFSFNTIIKISQLIFIPYIT